MYSYLYLTAPQVIAIHDHVLQLSGGMSGVVKSWLIESTLDFVQSDDYYPRFADKVSYLLYSIAMNHCFADGNKRTALVVAMQFVLLNTNDADLSSRFMREFENIVVWVADGSLSKESLTEYVDGFLWVWPSESTLLKVYQELHQHNLV
jgi:death-on-curing protein